MLQLQPQSQQLILANAFTLLGIVFHFTKHPYPYYAYLLAMLNSLYCTIPIEKHQLVTAGIFLDQGLTTIPVNIINHLRYHFISHATSICTDKATILSNILSQIPLILAQKIAVTGL